MGYVIAAILVLVIVAAAVAFFVLGAARKERGPAAVVSPDDRTPAGSTDQLSDEPAEGHGGESGTTRGSVPPVGEGGVGGEGESGAPVQPESERLANRER